VKMDGIHGSAYSFQTATLSFRRAPKRPKGILRQGSGGRGGGEGRGEYLGTLRYG